MIDPTSSEALRELFRTGRARLTEAEMECYKLWFIWKRGHPKYKKIAGWLYEDVDRKEARDIIMKMEQMYIDAELERQKRMKPRPIRRTS